MILKVKKKKSLGNDLLSQGAAPQVPSALIGLTTGFGMGPGVPLPRRPPTNYDLFVNKGQMNKNKNLQK